MGVELLNGIGVLRDTLPNQTPNTVNRIQGVSLRAIRFVDERETAQIAS
jgi:hypothetical protein